PFRRKAVEGVRTAWELAPSTSRRGPRYRLDANRGGDEPASASAGLRAKPSRRLLGTGKRVNLEPLAFLTVVQPPAGFVDFQPWKTVPSDRSVAASGEDALPLTALHLPTSRPIPGREVARRPSGVFPDLRYWRGFAIKRPQNFKKNSSKVCLVFELFG